LLSIQKLQNILILCISVLLKLAILMGKNIDNVQMAYETAINLLPELRKAYNA